MTALFGFEFSLRRRRKGWCLGESCISHCAPGSHFFLTFFRWLEANRAEREPGQARTFFVRRAAVEAKRRGLTRLPRSVHSPAKKGESPLPVSLGLWRFGVASVRKRPFTFVNGTRPKPLIRHAFTFANDR